MEERKVKGSFKGLLPLIGFLILYILAGVISGKFDSMPLLVGMTIAGIISFALPPAEGETKLTFQQKFMKFCKGAANPI